MCPPLTLQIVPLPLFFSHYVFSKSFFTLWIVVSFLWVSCAAAFCVVLPVWESKHQLWTIVRRLLDGSAFHKDQAHV